MIVGACQCSQFSKKIPGFSKTTELCLKFCVGFELHNQYYQIIENQSLKPNFILTTQATLQKKIGSKYEINKHYKIIIQERNFSQIQNCSSNAYFQHYKSKIQNTISQFLTPTKTNLKSNSTVSQIKSKYSKNVDFTRK